MTIDWKYTTINPYQAEWEKLSTEEKARFYRHNFMHRPEEVAKKSIINEDPLLKVIRNFISDSDDAGEALTKLKKESEKREQISKTGRKTTKNRKKV